jgi:methanogenic corrinoid protein MtbC1
MSIKKIPKKPTNILPEVFLDYLMDGEEQKAVELIKESHKNGIPFTSIIKDTIIPMMDRVGSLWEKGELTPAQEHYLSNIVEGLIAYWSNSLPRQVKKDWSVLLMTPGLEEHVLTLQIAAEYFRSKSWNVYYIGKSVPFDGLSHLIETHSIHVVVLSITMEANLKSCQELIFNIRKLNAKNSPLIVVGGPAVKTRQFAVNTLGADIFVPKVTDLSSIVEKIEKSLLKGL